MMIVPLRICFNDKGRAKIEIALARGKKKWVAAHREGKRAGVRALVASEAKQSSPA